MKKQFYRCENEFGQDPCEHATSGYKISQDEAKPSIKDDMPLCPGKTKSGADCNRPLVKIGNGRGGEKPIIVGVVVGCAVFLAMVWLLFFRCSGAVDMHISPDPLLFKKSGGGKVKTDLRIRNNGDNDLVIKKIEIRPNAFSIAEKEMKIAPGDMKVLSVEFEAPSSEITEGELILHVKCQDTPTIVKLRGNHHAWWVIEELEKTSKILQ